MTARSDDRNSIRGFLMRRKVLLGERRNHIFQYDVAIQLDDHRTLDRPSRSGPRPSAALGTSVTIDAWWRTWSTAPPFFALSEIVGPRSPRLTAGPEYRTDEHHRIAGGVIGGR